VTKGKNMQRYLVVAYVLIIGALVIGTALAGVRTLQFSPPAQGVVNVDCVAGEGAVQAVVEACAYDANTDVGECRRVSFDPGLTGNALCADAAIAWKNARGY
jgi:hypothetical protein